MLPPAPVMARRNIGALAASTSQVVTKLTTLILPSGLQVTTRLPQLLAGIASNIVLARSLFTIGALELLLVAAAALVLAARLLASLRDEESALLRARGATRWQLTRPVLAEALVIGAVASVVGVLAGVRLTGVLARAGQLRLDSYQASRISPLAWLSALVMVALCVAVMAWPALRAGTPDAARIRQGRQARLAGVAWAGGDLAVVALAALAVWQLRGYSAVAHPAAGSLGIDPVVAIAPALALAGVALVPLRTLPLLARLADGATEHGTAAGRRHGELADRPAADPPGGPGPARRRRDGHHHAGAGWVGRAGSSQLRTRPRSRLARTCGWTRRPADRWTPGRSPGSRVSPPRRRPASPAWAAGAS